jgi:uncharacterized protein YjbJ (UPF0337 family)
MFRSVRFGITEAHGRGVAMQFNYLTDEGAIKFNEAKGTFSVDHSKIKEGVTKLTHDLLTLEAEGSYDKAKAMLDKFAVIRPPMQQVLDKLKECAGGYRAGVSISQVSESYFDRIYKIKRGFTCQS